MTESKNGLDGMLTNADKPIIAYSLISPAPKYNKLKIFDASEGFSSGGSEIYVEYEKLPTIGEKCKATASSIEEIRENLQYMVSRLDWDVKSQDQIGKTADSLAKKLEKCASALEKYHKFLNYTREQYQKLDFYDTTVDAAGNSGVGKSEDEEDGITSLVKKFLTVLDKSGQSETADEEKKIVSYFESLYDFFTGEKKGADGFEDLTDLMDKSYELWKKFYDKAKKVYDGKGFFSLANQKAVGELGVITDIASYISSACKTVDTIKNDKNITMAGRIGEWLGTGDEAADLVEGVYDVTQIGKTATKGFYTPASLYSTTVKGITAAASQGLKSYEKYSADGEWSTKDTAETGIDLATAGLTKIFNGVTFGIVDIDAEDASSKIKNWAGSIGTKAGNYIKQNPTLCNAYNNAGPIGKLGLISSAVVHSTFDRNLTR